jgi:hypothetical protein
LSGVAATGEVGQVTASIPVNVEVTGVFATGHVGLPTVGIGISTTLTGVQAIGEISGVVIWLEIQPAQDPNWVEIAA